MIDTSGYVPHVVRDSAEALAGSGLYCFVSSISVYADFSEPVDEDSPVAPLGEHPGDEITDENYGALKALCETAVREVFAERALVVRPGPDRRPSRSDRALHVLAPPHRARRRDPRTGSARASDPVRRRA